jgi:hypothetical protein
MVNNDYSIPKYDGSPSIYTLRDFNGMFIPTGITNIVSNRILIAGDMEQWRIAMMQYIFNIDIFQHICIGLDSNVSTLFNQMLYKDTIGRMNILMSGKWKCGIGLLTLSSLEKYASVIPPNELIDETCRRMRSMLLVERPTSTLIGKIPLSALIQRSSDPRVLSLCRMHPSF